MKYTLAVAALLATATANEHEDHDQNLAEVIIIGGMVFCAFSVGCKERSTIFKKEP